MKLPILAAAAASALFLAGCETQTQVQTTAAGAATGALVGGFASGSLAGAAVGGAVGAAAGNLIGRAVDNDDVCIYRDRDGNRYRAACPS